MNFNNETINEEIRALQKEKERIERSYIPEPVYNHIGLTRWQHKIDRQENIEVPIREICKRIDKLNELKHFENNIEAVGIEKEYFG